MKKRWLGLVVSTASVVTQSMYAEASPKQESQYLLQSFMSSQFGITTQAVQLQHVFSHTPGSRVYGSQPSGRTFQEAFAKAIMFGAEHTYNDVRWLPQSEWPRVSSIALDGKWTTQFARMPSGPLGENLNPKSDDSSLNR